MPRSGHPPVSCIAQPKRFIFFFLHCVTPPALGSAVLQAKIIMRARKFAFVSADDFFFSPLHSSNLLPPSPAYPEGVGLCAVTLVYYSLLHRRQVQSVAVLNRWRADAPSHRSLFLYLRQRFHSTATNFYTRCTDKQTIWCRFRRIYFFNKQSYLRHRRANSCLWRRLLLDLIKNNSDGGR